MKKRTLLFLLLSALSIGLPAQKAEIINKEATRFALPDKQGNIEFIVLDTLLKDKKPVFLWCQGSLPYPLYIQSTAGLWLIGGGLTNFDVQRIRKHYHLVVISMPQTPIIADESEINDSYWYFGNSKDKNIPTDDFQKADYLENYVNRGVKVLKYLRKQSWVNPSGLVVAGHSQGTKVATKIAKAYKHVSKLGLFGANPFGRIDQNIRRYRKEAEQNHITWEEADQKIEEQVQLLRDANNPEKTAVDPSLLAWKSFSVSLLDDWLNFNKPIYLAYGTHDLTSDLCDMVPLFFIKENKNNLTYKRHLKLEHNFFEVDENGQANYNKPHWPEIMNDFIEWTLNDR